MGDAPPYHRSKPDWRRQHQPGRPIRHLPWFNVSQAIVFDGDDTLWRTEPLYDDARQRARGVVEGAGLDGSEWETLERRLDVENVARLGHGVTRFPTSCVEAYEQLCSEQGRPIAPDVSEQIWDAASTAFTEPAPLVPGARNVLEALRWRGLRLALLTKGDPELQRRRIEQSGLVDLFDVVEVVEEKTPAAYQHVLSELGVPASAALGVGNSVRSDVLPSLAAGVQPIWIDAYVWEYERSEGELDPRVIAISDLADLLEVAT
jgi:putative hydrolase of the HAD superfamily